MCHYNNALGCIAELPPIMGNAGNLIAVNIANMGNCAAQHLMCPAYNSIFGNGVCWNAVQACIYLGSGPAAQGLAVAVLNQATPQDVLIQAQAALQALPAAHVLKFFEVHAGVQALQAAHVMLGIGNGQACGSNNGAFGVMNPAWSVHNVGAFAWAGNQMQVPDNGTNRLFVVHAMPV